jgi:DNA-directed RNA polymerase subunit M/transcription elongation factor TFIIS
MSGGSPLEAKMVRNDAGDGWKPVCPKCGYEFEDGETNGSLKNYPDDGVVAVFFNCPRCKEEVSCFAAYEP